MAVSDPRTDIPAVTRAGWQCPECKTVYSPDVRQCDCATVNRSFAERVHWGNSVGSCTCTPYGLGTVRCPVHQGARSAAVCTCPSVWGGIMPPPACPAHGQTEVFRVTC